MKRVDLFLELQYTITMLRGKTKRTVTPEEARKLWKAGLVDDYNIAFARLVQLDFDVDAVKAYYARQAAARAPHGA